MFIYCVFFFEFVKAFQSPVRHLCLREHVQLTYYYKNSWTGRAKWKPLRFELEPYGGKGLQTYRIWKKIHMMARCTFGTDLTMRTLLNRLPTEVVDVVSLPFRGHILFRRRHFLYHWKNKDSYEYFGSLVSYTINIHWSIHSTGSKPANCWCW